jgi:hypothetical protein
LVFSADFSLIGQWEGAPGASHIPAKDAAISRERKWNMKTPTTPSSPTAPATEDGKQETEYGIQKTE